ncbi:hypothetical protein BGW38_006998 [Lunasporangiospora selenospora]|uniref:Chitin-binding type-4 domain-containing protein n=1 Tax=Lunasporangiospora selenospora TaxID=979761 RepID=A0A9P6FYR2_9FUNG|nr:hypothetical protein BGW38_006998 [Lunasporangiospora selenospora]
MLFKSTLVTIVVACLSVVAVQAHSSIEYPCPRYANFKGCPAPPKGKQSSTPATKRFKVKAGQTISTKYNIGASHGGGHCQWALSYDNGKNWVVIHTVMRNCLKGAQFGANVKIPVKIPSSAPGGKAILQWYWNNAIGNRELYSNCIDIDVQGKNGGKLSGVQPLIANYGRKSYHIPEFPGAKDKDGSDAFKKRRKITITVPKRK